MPKSSELHQSLRQEWAETPPDVSYRFVVSQETLRAADAVVSAVRKKKARRWKRALGFPRLRRFCTTCVMTGYVVLVAWLSFQAARLFDATFLRIMAFLVAFVGLTAGVGFFGRRASKLPFRQLYREFYSGNEFLLEGRKSHLWFEERSAGAIRQWSTFESIVEFDEGMWLFLRRSTTFAGLRGILISKESLPGSCAWSELKVYLSQRIEEGAEDEAQARTTSSA